MYWLHDDLLKLDNYQNMFNLYCYMYICSITRNCNSLRNKIYISIYLWTPVL